MDVLNCCLPIDITSIIRQNPTLRSHEGSTYLSKWEILNYVSPQNIIKLERG